MTTDSVINRFLRDLALDRDRGLDLGLDHYLERFPGHEAAIREEWELLHGGGEAPPTDAEVPPGDVPSPGAVVGPYRLVQVLGRGGQGVVYLAEDSRLGRRVALKLLTGLGRLSSEAARRFRREARVAARLDHPGICTVHEAGDADGVLFIAMRYVEGTSLAQCLAAARRAAGDGGPVIDASVAPPLELDEPGLIASVRLVEKAARAVQAAHDAGIIHRDIKPGNVIVTGDGDPVLLDFGLARDLEISGVTLTHSEGILGTPAYAAPEQLRSDADSGDPRTDVHALGAVLYECLTLRRPFEGANREALFRAILQDEVPGLGRLNSALSRDVKTVLEKALAKDPAQRYASARDLADDLGRLQRGEPVRARPVSPLRRGLRWVRRHPAPSSALALAVVLAAVGGFVGAQWPEISEGLELRRERETERLADAAWLSLAESRPEEAAAGFERVLARAPDSEAALAGLVLSRHAEAGPETALALLRERAAGRPESRSLKMLESELRRMMGETLSEALPQSVSSLEWFLLGWIRILHARTGRLGLWEHAVDDLARALLDPDEDRASMYFAMAAALEHLDEPVRARWLADLLVRRWPDSLPARYWAGRALSTADPETARERLERLAREHPEHAPSRLAAARILIRTGGDATAARALVEEALAIDPESAVALRMQIYAAEAQGHLDEALTLARALVERRPRSGKDWSLLGGLQLRARRPDAAAKSLGEAVRWDALHWRAHDELGRAHALRGRVGPALRCFTRAAELEPRAFSPHCNRGLAALGLRRDREALAAFRAAHELEPKNSHAARGLARALWLTGDAVGAEEVLVGLGAPDDDPWLRRYRLAARGAPTVDASTRNGELLLIRAVAAEARGEWSEAARCWAACDRPAGPSPLDRPRIRAALCLLRGPAGTAEEDPARRQRERARAWIRQALGDAVESSARDGGSVLRLLGTGLREAPGLGALLQGTATAPAAPEEREAWRDLGREIREALDRAPGAQEKSP